MHLLIVNLLFYRSLDGSFSLRANVVNGDGVEVASNIIAEALLEV